MASSGARTKCKCGEHEPVSRQATKTVQTTPLTPPAMAARSAAALAPPAGPQMEILVVPPAARTTQPATEHKAQPSVPPSQPAQQRLNQISADQLATYQMSELVHQMRERAGQEEARQAELLRPIMQKARRVAGILMGEDTFEADVARFERVLGVMEGMHHAVLANHGKDGGSTGPPQSTQCG